ncbi:ROK family protein [Vagococcus intermedius]|uniref:ROK family protein n=1 Tax=Vagococcus intermedius TaxID=2991418 RepID=A0AAF0CTE5_9ENTE|nr:ROK family protein [Vagococcus intermedius]WEG72529.1 ROK family protein [Vagococcus intermedius]WEG74617.1 ROK family protein [Vagococcus intermedius]
MANYLCIDIGGTAIKYAQSDEKGKLEKVASCPTPDSLSGLLSKVQTLASERATNISGVAISMPGLLDSETGHIVHGGALTYLEDINIRQLFRDRLPGIPLHIENDGKCSAIGEKQFGELQGIENGVVLVFGTGVGGGIIINNQLVKGANLSAGEFSFIRTNPMTSAYHDFFAMQGSVRVLIKNYQELSGCDQPITGEQFFEKIKEGNELALKLFDDYTKKISQQLFNIQTMLDPEVIVIGGGVSQQTILIDALEAKLVEEVSKFPIPLIKPQIRQSKLGNQANLLGALANFLEKEQLV